MQARYYDPVIGRFYSNDPLGFRDIHSFNRYAYANNNPYKYVDPDGKSSYGAQSLAKNTSDFNKVRVANGVSNLEVLGDITGATDLKNAVNSFLDGDFSGAATSVAVAVIKPAKILDKTKIFSKEKQALVDMAKMDKKNDGVTQGDMDAYSDLNAELPDPFPSNKVRGLESHPNRPHGKDPHGHVGPVNHIPEKKLDN
ncbi:MAG: hypothetical protein ACJAS9_003033 [Polaribacter sp.]|jgi:uncharacterized protein RhaS with RHS repeats